MVTAFLTKMTSESSSAQESLNKDKSELEGRLKHLNEELPQYQPSDTQKPDDQVEFGSQTVQRSVALRRTNMAIRATRRRLKMINRELNAMPGETEAAGKLLSNLNQAH